MGEDNHEMLIQMSDIDYEDTIILIEQITARRESARRRKGLGEPKAKRKGIPNLKIVSNSGGIITVSLQESDYKQLQDIFRAVKRSRARYRKYDQKKLGVCRESKARELPAITIVK